MDINIFPTSVLVFLLSSKVSANLSPVSAEVSVELGRGKVEVNHLYVIR